MCYFTVHVSSRKALTVLNIVGEAVIVMNFAMLFVYAAEIFPTEVRSGAMGVAHGGAQWSDGRGPVVHVRRWRIGTLHCRSNGQI